GPLPIRPGFGYARASPLEPLVRGCASCRSASRERDLQEGATHRRSIYTPVRGFCSAGFAGAFPCARLGHVKRSAPRGSTSSEEAEVVQHSKDRILTTHVGSLPRPPDLLALLEARESGA